MKSIGDKGSETPTGVSGAEKPSIHPFRKMIEEAGEGFYEADINGNLRGFNEAFCQVLGYSREELQDRNPVSFMDKGSGRRLRDAMNRVWVTHQGFSNLVWEIKDRNGNPKIIELSAYLMKNHRGRKLGFRGIARDVTQQFKTMQELREAQRRYEKEFQEGRKARKRAKNLLDFVPYPMVVFTLAGKVSYVNPAFTEVFGWSLEELIGKSIPFVPPGLKEKTLDDLKRLLKKKDETIETKRLTRDGRILDVVVRGQVASDAEDDGFDELFIFRDVTEQRRMERINEMLFQISRALPQYPVLTELLDYITSEVKSVLHTEGAIVGLYDREHNHFHFLGVAYDNASARKQIKAIRHPFEKSISGRVVTTGEPVIVNDTAAEPDYYDGVDRAIGLHTRNMVVVPLNARERVVGVLIAINKKSGNFDDWDSRLLTMIGSTAALSIENARYAKELNEAYEEVSSLNRAKDRIIDHLSHELKTPVAILMASLKMLSRRLAQLPEEEWRAAFDRAARNLDRILDIQYQVGDIMRDPEYKVHSMLSFLLDQCVDELEGLVAERTGDEDIARWIRDRIDAEFGPRESEPEAISLETFAKKRLQNLRPLFSTREVDIQIGFEPVPPICLPSQVLQKVVDGLIRNAVENTPDQGKIDIFVRPGEDTVELRVTDTGIGIAAEDRKRIFEGFFPTQESMDYSSKRPFAFNAGGKGADILRMKVFSERYGFQIHMESTRCRFIPCKGDPCPGRIDACPHCEAPADCFRSGGTTFRLLFPAAPNKGCESEMPSCADVMHCTVNPSAESMPSRPEDRPPSNCFTQRFCLISCGIFCR